MSITIIVHCNKCKRRIPQSGRRYRVTIEYGLAYAPHPARQVRADFCQTCATQEGITDLTFRPEDGENIDDVDAMIRAAHPPKKKAKS